MYKSTAIGSSSLTAIVLAWSGNALAQSAAIELVEVSLTARTQEAAVARSSAVSDSLKLTGNSSLRMATRANSANPARDHLNVRPSSVARSSGAGVSARCQSEVAEHRQERRGATTAGKSGPGGKGPNSG